MPQKECGKRSSITFFVFGTLSVTFRSLFVTLLSLFSSLFCQTPFAGLLLRQGENLQPQVSRENRQKSFPENRWDQFLRTSQQKGKRQNCPERRLFRPIGTFSGQARVWISPTPRVRPANMNKNTQTKKKLNTRRHPPLRRSLLTHLGDALKLSFYRVHAEGVVLCEEALPGSLWDESRKVKSLECAGVCPKELSH